MRCVRTLVNKVGVKITVKPARILVRLHRFVKLVVKQLLVRILVKLQGVKEIVRIARTVARQEPVR